MNQQELQRLVTYNSETGIFTRNIAMGLYDRFKPGSIIGSKHSQGYLVAVFGSTVYRLHRLAWLYHYVYMPKEIDHINGIKHDNRISNLRKCTRSENVCNYTNKINNSTGIKGVYFSKREKKYKAQIRLNGSSLYKGFPIHEYGYKEKL